MTDVALQADVLRASDAMQDGAAGDIPDSLRAASPLQARKVLVLGAARLGDTLEAALRAKRWEPVYAETTDDALRLVREHRLLVGLMLLQQPFDPAQLQAYRALARSLNQLEWIGALDRAMVGHVEVRRFIFEQLRDFQVFPLDPERLAVVLGHACGLASIGESLCREHAGSGRDVVSPLVRKLLVVAKDRLGEGLESALECRGWRPIYAQSREDVLRLNAEHRFKVGLLLMPQPFDEARFLACRALAAEVRQLEWIAGLDRAHVERDDVKHFIVDQLRDFQVFPLDPERLAVVLGHACGLASIGESLRRKQVGIAEGRFGLIGSSAAMRELHVSIGRVAEADIPVLILGETGTGKELVARGIHKASARASGPFVAINCAAIPASLLQSELFGYEKGAFTGAFSRKTGLIEAASGGTLLLDEIGEMPLEAQSSLLRFLDDKKVTPIGGTRTASVDVRVIAATNRDLEQDIKHRAFREDLFYRLAVFTVRTPRLRDRGEDVDTLAGFFLRSAADTLAKPVQGLTHDALQILRQYDWPGNVRELRSWMLQAVMACSGKRVTARDLVQARPMPSRAPSLSDAKDNAARTTLEQALSQNLWNVTQTAKALGVSRMTLYRLMERHQIARDPDRKAAP